MSTYSYQARLDIYQKQRISELTQENTQLNIQLHHAEDEIRSLQLEVHDLEGVQSTQTVALHTATDEVERLSLLTPP